MSFLSAGIDLGTAFSAIAVVGEDGHPRVLPNARGENLTPTVVCFPPEGLPLIGQEALDEELLGAWPTAGFFKRNMGRPDFRLHLGGRDYDPTDLSAIFLRGLKAEVESRLGATLDQAVITVPAYFNNSQREATMTAGDQAGFKIIRAVNEPTAATLAYYERRRPDGSQTLLVYDLGGGTFDVTLARVTPDGLEVLATAGDHFLGGKDWDDRLAEAVAARFAEEFGHDPLADETSAAIVRADCEKAKRGLSQLRRTVVTVAYDGCRGRYEIDRDYFDRITADLRESTRLLCEATLAEAGLDWGGVNGSLLVGGSTRMKQIPDLITEMSGAPPWGGINADEAVALGAAIQAEIETRAERPKPLFFLGAAPPTISDVMSHSLGMVAENSDRSAYINSIILPKNQPIPRAETRPYALAAGAVELEVYVLQGESEYPWETTILGKYVFSGFKPARSGQTIIEVRYAYDISGVVRVSAAQPGGQGQLPPPRLEPMPEDMEWLRRPPRDNDLTAGPTEKAVVYLVMDMSGSMEGAPLKEAQRAAASLTGRLDWSRFSVGLITFSGEVHLRLKATNKPRRVLEAVDSLSAGGGTCGRAFQMAHELLAGRKERRFLIVLTDGRWMDQARAIEEAGQCHAAGIEVVALGFGGADREFLRRISSCDENALFVDLNHLTETFSRIGRELNASLALGPAEAVSPDPAAPKKGFLARWFRQSQD